MVQEAIGVGNSIIATSRTLPSVPMRPLVVLFGLFMVSSFLFPVIDEQIPSVAADSVPFWTRDFHLHEGIDTNSTNQDWMNSSGPVDPGYVDYDGDGLAGVTIKKNLAPNPPERCHSWVLYPAVNRIVTLAGNIEVYLWARSQGNESATLVQAVFYDITSAQISDPRAGIEIAIANSGLTGPYYSEFQLVHVTVPLLTYSLPADHLLALVVERGDSQNDWLIVWYDNPYYDSYMVLGTRTFISVDQAETQDLYGMSRSTFSNLEHITVEANVSNPFGAYEIVAANVTVMNASDQTVLFNRLPMANVRNDSSSIPYWKLFNVSLPMLPSGGYLLNVTARDVEGYPTWQNVTATVVAADHFDVYAPSRIEAGTPFALTVIAKGAMNQTLTDWVGTVQLAPYRTDKATASNGSLAVDSIAFAPSSNGSVAVPNEVYDFAEETIYIQASAGSSIGWSNLTQVSSGPVAVITILPSGLVEVESGTTRLFTATGFDSNDNVNTSWSANWSVSPGIGSISVNGLSATFNASNTGLGLLTCINDVTGANSSVLILVTSGLVVRIEMDAPDPLVIHEGESFVLNATGYDSFNNTVLLSDAAWYTTTAGTFNVSFGPTVTFTAGTIPQSGTIGVMDGAASANVSVIVLHSLDGPSWNSPIPSQITPEDTGTWTEELTGRWQDPDGTHTLDWWVEDVNTSLYLVSHDPDTKAIIVFYTQPNKYGDDQFIIWVVDDTGYRAFQWVTVRITPVNDAPKFINEPPTELFVKFDTEYDFNWSYYVQDVDNDKMDLTIESSSSHINMVGLVGYFLYPSEANLDFELVTLRLFDYEGGSATSSLVVRITDDTPPGLNDSLPPMTVEEGVVDYFLYDLDDYFFDEDGDFLVFQSGFANIIITINKTTHKVYVSTPYEWFGLTEGTLTAKDPTGAIKTDTVSITVTPVNDPPEIRDLDPDQPIQVRYEVPFYVYLGPYVIDPDHSLESLSFSFSNSNVSLGYSMTGAARLVLLFNASPTGPVYTGPYTVNVRMTVTDPDGASDFEDFVVRVTDNNPPVVIALNPDSLYFNFPEDSYLNNSVVLYDIFFDADDTFLSFTLDGNAHVYCLVSAAGFISLTAEVDWYGLEKINLTAWDDDGGWAIVQINVVVTPVNDAPVLTQLPGLVSDLRSDRFDISGFIKDCDNNVTTELTWMIVPGDGSVSIIGGFLYFQLPKGVDSLPVSLTASDGELESEMITFRISIEKTMADKIGWPYSFPLILLAAGVAGYYFGTKIPKKFNLENLFLIHNDGRLITHVTKEENTLLDKDVVSAMFTAVQEFVKDSFQKGEVGLKKLEIGDKNVVIEKGGSVYLALIYSGWPPKEKFEELSMLLRDIEERFKPKLERWNGTLKAVAGVHKMLQIYMAATYKPGAWQEEEEIAEEEWVQILDKET